MDATGPVSRASGLLLATARTSAPRAARGTTAPEIAATPSPVPRVQPWQGTGPTRSAIASGAQTGTTPRRRVQPLALLAPPVTSAARPPQLRRHARRGHIRVPVPSSVRPAQTAITVLLRRRSPVCPARPGMSVPTRPRSRASVLPVRTATETPPFVRIAPRGTIVRAPAARRRFARKDRTRSTIGLTASCAHLDTTA